MTTGFRYLFCHPEPGPELDSGSIDFGISVFGFKNLGFKAPSCGRGSLLFIFSPILASFGSGSVWNIEVTTGSIIESDSI